MGESTITCALSGLPLRSGLAIAIAKSKGRWWPVSLPTFCITDDYGKILFCPEHENEVPDAILTKLQVDEPYEDGEPAFRTARIRFLETHLVTVHRDAWYLLAGIPFPLEDGFDAEQWMEELPAFPSCIDEALPLKGHRDLYGLSLVKRPLAMRMTAAVARRGIDISPYPDHCMHLGDDDVVELDRVFGEWTQLNRDPKAATWLAKLFPRREPVRKPHPSDAVRHIPGFDALANHLRREWEADEPSAELTRLRAFEGKIEGLLREELRSAVDEPQYGPDLPPVGRPDEWQERKPAPIDPNRLEHLVIRRSVQGPMTLEIRRADLPKIRAAMEQPRGRVRGPHGSRSLYLQQSAEAHFGKSSEKWLLRHNAALRAELERPFEPVGFFELESLPGFALALV